MTDEEHQREESNAKLRQRLWGAAVLIALLVIVLPLVLDGAGSESQFRRVERLREEPPRVIDANGELEPPVAPRVSDPVADPVDTPPNDAAAAPDVSAPEPRVYVGDDPPPNYYESIPASGPDPVAGPVDTEPLTAWVVQAGSFEDQGNAIAVRDRLRRAGFPSFVSAADEGDTLFRVRVGPMIDAYRAQSTRDAVVSLLGRDAFVVKYP